MMLYYLLKTRGKYQSNVNESITLKEYQHIIVNLLNKIFSFYETIDSKLIGLIVFLNSNLLTGLVNLTIDTREVRAFGSVMILILHALASVGSGFLIYHLFNILKKKKPGVLTEANEHFSVISNN